MGAEFAGRSVYYRAVPPPATSKSLRLTIGLNAWLERSDFEKAGKACQ